MTRHTCRTCRYWVGFFEAAPDAVLGECHRRSPQALHLDGELDFSACFPETDHNQWCGEHPEIMKEMRNGRL